MATTDQALQIPATREELLSLQTERRAAAVRSALRSPFFAEKSAHINLDAITEEEEWAKIPILDKEQLRALDSETFYNQFCIAPRKDISEYWRSGGSTGRPLFYPRTSQDVFYGKIGFKRVLDAAGLTADDIVHMSLPLGIHPAGHLMARSGSELDIGMVWAGGGNTLPSKAQLDLLQLFKPTAWIGMASYGIQLANLARSEGQDLSKQDVAKILCTAEPLSNSKRQKLSSLWGADVHDSFGMTEMMMLAGEEPAQHGFRFWSDFCYPEVLDTETMEPVAEGESGVLVVTSLVTNNATPFIRWNSGDIVTMTRGEPQGSKYDVFPLISHTHRTAGFVKVRGVNIGFTDFEDTMFASEEVSDFRAEIVWQGDRDELDLFVELAEPGNRDVAVDAVKASVRRVFDVMPRVTVCEGGTIAQEFEGSFKPVRFVDLRSQETNSGS